MKRSSVKKSRNTSSIPAIFFLPVRFNLMPHWASSVQVIFAQRLKPAATKLHNYLKKLLAKLKYYCTITTVQAKKRAVDAK